MLTSTRLLAILSVPLIYLAACATAGQGPGELTEQTSDPQAVDAREDNATVLAETTPGLIITLEMDGNAITSYDVQVVSLSGSSTSRTDQDDAVIVTGMGNGVQVASMSVDAGTLAVQEEVGLVTVEKRTLVGMMALPSRIDTLVVEAPGMARAEELDVREAFDDFCEKYRQQSICESK